jgi:ABC-type metal ion transport system substrate-binding protein
MFKLSSLFSKTKKNPLFVLLTISFFCNLLFGYFLWNANKSLSDNNYNQKNHKLTVATALPTVKYFLEGYVKNRLKEYNIDLSIKYVSSGFEQTNELLLNKQVDAKLDSHVHHLNIFNQKVQEQDQLTFSQAVYLAKFGLFAKSNIFNGLEGIKITNHHNNLKILMPQDNFQRSLALRVLQKLGIIKETNNIAKEKFNLKTTDFQSTNLYPKIEYTTELDLMKITNKFIASNEFDLCLNYPTLMGLGTNKFQLLGIMPEPTQPDDILYSYAISLLTTQNNENNWKIKILKDVLKEDKAIEYMEASPFKDNFYMIPRNVIEQISKIIKEKYLGKTSASPASN